MLKRIPCLLVGLFAAAAAPHGHAQVAPATAVRQTAYAMDLGAAADGTPIRRIQLVLKRQDAQEQRLASLLADQQAVNSKRFHQWVDPVSFGAAYGPSAADLSRVTGWLAGEGFAAIQVNRGRTLIEFSGTAAQVRNAFHVEVHAFSLGTERFYANTTAGEIPAGLQADITGIVSLRSVPSRTKVSAPQVTAAGTAKLHPNYTLASNNSVYYPLTPYDFAALYNVLPLWKAATPIDGTGQTIAIVGDTDINPADFVAFRQLFSLPLGNTTTPTGTEFLNIIYNGPKPAVRPDEFHADSDTQWAAAVAKGAVIDYVASESTEVSSGNDLSAAYIVDNNLASVMVYSYSQCELSLGTAGNAFYKALWQQAAAQGIAVVTPSGDSGAAGCDAAHVAPAAAGPAVNGIGSTPYNVSVGGTEFFTPNGPAAYFQPSNDLNHESLFGYVPETVWNDSCTNAEILAAAPYVGLSAEQACNSSSAATNGLNTTIGSGGGQSACTVSDGVHPNTCSGGYAKPSWQTSPGVPSDGVRDVPDVALFSSQGRTNSFYVVCQQSRNQDGKPCNLDFPYSDFSAYGGTEIATPAFAGILALAAQKTATATGNRLGNPNYVLYALATLQTTMGLQCDSTGSLNSACYFHDITKGTNAMPCVSGSPGCGTATAGDPYGLLTVFAAGAGYDRATGLGSVDAANLVNGWAKPLASTTSAVLAVTPASVPHGSGISATITVSGNPTPTGDVSLNAQAANGSIFAGTLIGGSLAQTFRTLPGGTYGLRAHYGGDGFNLPTDSNFVSVTVAPEPSLTSFKPLSFDPKNGTATALSSAPYGTIFYLRSDVSGQSGQGVATGNIGLTDNGAILGSGVYRLNSTGYAEAQNNALAPGAHALVASYSGDISFAASSAPTALLTITRAPTTASVTTSVQTVSVASIVTLSAVIGTQGYGYLAPSGSVSFLTGSQLLGTSTLQADNDKVTFNRIATATLTLSAMPFPLGNDPITVVFNGDANYLASSSRAVGLGVTDSKLLPTTTMLQETPGSVMPMGSITLTAEVSPNAPAPTGTLQFAIDGQNVSNPVPMAGGAAGLSVSVTKLLPGLHTATAVYSGDLTTYRSSQSASTPFFISSPSGLGLPTFTAQPAVAVRGTFISVAAKVGPQVPTATGTVQLVLDGGPYGGPVPLSTAAATLPLVTGTIQVGTHVLTVFYSGDTNYSASYAPPTNITISAPGNTPSAINLSGLPAQINLGSAATFNADVTPTNPTPTGILQISLDGGNPGPPILLTGNSTPLSIPSAVLPLGMHTVSVFYSGDATYNSARTFVQTFRVVVPVITGTFVLSPASTTLTALRTGGSPVLTYTATPQGGFTGTVTFSCSNLPANTGCSFSPASVSFLGTAAVTTALTLQLNTGLKAGVENSFQKALGGIALAAVLGLLWPGRRKGIRSVLAMLLLASLAALGGCGGGYAPGTSAPGNYTIQVIATSGTNTQTATINATIQ